MRDRRLLIGMLLFLVALIAGSIQAWIVMLYIDAAVMGGWDHFIDFFGLTPITGSDQYCLDYCAPSLPFIAGWIGLAAFLLGWIMVSLAWWRPKPD